MNENKKKRIRIIGSLMLVILSFFLKVDSKWYPEILYVIAYILVGYEIVLEAIKNCFKGKVFDENFLMAVATIGAFCIGEFLEAVAVMFLYQVGELFQDYAVGQSRKSVTSLMDIRPDYANVEKNGKVEKIDPSKVRIGEEILVKPGEKIPLDGMITEGESFLNTVALTGEPILRKVVVGDKVMSGCVNHDGILRVNVEKSFEESTVSKILNLVENATARKSKSEHFIHTFAQIYTPVVVVIAFFLALIPPLILKDALFQTWLYRALSFLVISCPCALVISIPLSFFSGIGAASKIGVLIKGSNYLEALAHTEIIVCDKTGTITEGVFQVQKVEAIQYSENELLEYATYAEAFSNHPISLSLKQAYGKEIDQSLVSKTQEISGKGIKACVRGKMVLIGNEKLMEEYQIPFQKKIEIGTMLYIAIDHVFAGTILISDHIKEDSYRAISLWRKNHVSKIVMLSGDHENSTAAVAKELQIDEYHSELLPQDKVSWVEALLTQKSVQGKLLFVGDGINDAPVLALSDIGVAMGVLGSDAAIEAADVVIMTDELSKIAHAIRLSRNTMKIVRENIFLALLIKVSVLLLSAFGYVTMWAAVLADVGVSILAILNALRILIGTKKR